MDATRRTLLKAGAAIAPAALFGGSAFAAETGTATEILKPYGLDLFTVHRKMFASTAPTSSCVWWYLGVDHMPVDGMGDVPDSQVDCMMLYRAETPAADTAKIMYRERGCFRDIATGELPGPWTNPVTGQIQTRPVSFVDGPGTYIVRKTATGVDVSLDQATATDTKVAVTVSIADGRVCLTQTEDKMRGSPKTPPRPLQSILKIYASLDALRDPKVLSADASGFYSTGSPDTPVRRTRGLMRKAAVNEKLNPIAWERIKAAYPKAFKGDEYDPWGDNG